mgnify:CR=1 FL=1
MEDAMGHGTMVPETRYGTARRLAREAEDRVAEAEVRERFERGKRLAAEKEVRIAQETARCMTETCNAMADDMAAIPCLMDMIAEAEEAAYGRAVLAEEEQR